MTGAAVSVAVLAGVLGGILGAVVGPAAGTLGGAAIGGLGGVALGWRHRQRVDRLTRQIDHWLGDGADARRRSTVVVVDGDDAWRRLGATLNRVGEAFDAQRDQLSRERPWRDDLVGSLVGPALLFDDGGYLVAANEPAREILGLPSDAASVTVVQALGSAPLVDAVARAQRRPGHVEADAEIGDRQVRASVATVGAQTLVILTDRTQERRIEELRRNFVVNASHELKTPATAIHTLAEALEITAERDPRRVPDLVVRLREESERLVRLVHDLLNLRRLEERPEVDAVAMDLVEVVRDVVAELEERAAARSIDLGLSVPDHAQLYGEPDDVRLVVRNLVANAIQYNRDGGRVDLRISAATSTQGPAWTLDVADTGIGIPQHDLQRIFERFYRVDVARSRETGGTGLGLSIVRHAVERHHGTIRVDSLLGEGTTFSVTLPAAASTPGR